MLSATTVKSAVVASEGSVSSMWPSVRRWNIPSMPRKASCPVPDPASRIVRPLGSTNARLPGYDRVLNVAVAGQSKGSTTPRTPGRSGWPGLHRVGRGKKGEVREVLPVGCVILGPQRRRLDRRRVVGLRGVVVLGQSRQRVHLVEHRQVVTVLRRQELVLLVQLGEEARLRVAVEDEARVAEGNQSRARCRPRRPWHWLVSDGHSAAPLAAKSQSSGAGRLELGSGPVGKSERIELPTGARVVGRDGVLSHRQRLDHRRTAEPAQRQRLRGPELRGVVPRPCPWNWRS